MNILIIGGGLIGIEIASTLIDYGNKIIIVEILEDIARDMELVTRKLNIMKLKKNDVSIYTNTRVEKISGSTVFLKSQNSADKLRIDNVDVFVVAAGMQPEKHLLDDLRNKIPVYPVGDAYKVGDVVSAIQSAYFTCKEL